MPIAERLDLNDLEALVQASEHAGLRAVLFEEGTTILGRNVSNDRLYVILDGEAELYRNSEDGVEVLIDRLGRGAFLGLLSFWTRNPSLTRSVAASRLRCLVISRVELDSISQSVPEFSQRLHPIFIANLCSRYHGLVNLNLKVERLGRQLEAERNELKDTVAELERTRLTLVHREKLATMGQLVAGIAHEINNPGSALQRGIESLENRFRDFFSEGGVFGTFKLEGALIELGCNSSPTDTELHRNRMQEVGKRFPGLPRPLQRRVAHLNEEGMQRIEETLVRVGKGKCGADEALLRLLDCYELGTLLRTVDVSGNRMLRLVRSLKSYGRPNAEEVEETDLSQNIRDTLTVLQYRLKRYDFRVEVPESTMVRCSPGEINQVVTNLLTNACDATEEGKGIVIRLTEDGNEVCIQVLDEGTGIPERLLEKIFEPNVTTKSSGGAFGLGLGLAISREIAKKHGGSLTVRNREEGGACFELRLPRGMG